MEIVLILYFICILIIVIVYLSRHYRQQEFDWKKREVEYICRKKIKTQQSELETESIGKIGEKTTETILRQIKECEYMLKNLYIPAAKGGTTEVDLVSFTNRGLLVLETKNYSGIIYGDENSEQWFALLNSQKNYFHNPIKQNNTHTKYLNKVVVANIPIYSIIVFSDRCSIEYLPHNYNDVYICQMSNLKNTIKEISNENPACIKSVNLYAIYNRIKKYANPNKNVIRKHKEYVNSKKYSYM